MFSITAKDGLKVVDSSTVICLRHVKGSGGSLPTSGFPRNTVKTMLGGQQTVEFKTGWQVLMGQSEVKNWLRSTKDKTVTMRYAGEYKFAGGTVDASESIAEAGRRELEEEFLAPAGVKLPAEAVLRPLSVKQTMPVKSKSNLMFNFVALASENEWLADLDIDHVNSALAARRETHANLVKSDKFWTLSEEEKEAVAPEIHRIAWVPLHEAFGMTLATMNDTVLPIDDFQREQFELYGIKRRDPMFMTAVALFEIESFPSEESIALECLPGDDELESRRSEIQWLFNGYTDADLASARESKQMMKNIREVEALREERSAKVARNLLPSRL